MAQAASKFWVLLVEGDSKPKEKRYPTKASAEAEAMRVATDSRQTVFVLEALSEFTQSDAPIVQITLI